MSAPISKRNVEINGRTFIIGVLKVANGCFVVVSEGSELKLGSVSMSVKSGEQMSSSMLVPGKFGGFLDTMLSEMVANVVKGIVVASLFISREMDSQSIKKLLSEVRSLL